VKFSTQFRDYVLLMKIRADPETRKVASSTEGLPLHKR
jgi:hypothetical protein